MRPFIIAPAAERDIQTVLAWTHEHFGERARRRYEALLLQAISDVAENSDLPGSSRRDEIAADARTYHLAHSKDRVARRTGRVKRPRHFLLFRVRDDGRVEIGRVLHDSMDLPSHLPSEYRASGDDA
jgi:toxin ParE1/3/4